jgi:hypothetical protein
MFFWDVSPVSYRRFKKNSHVQKQLPKISFGGSTVGVSYLDCEPIVGYVSGTFWLKECQSLRCPIRNVMPEVAVVPSRFCREDRCCFFRRLS